MTGFSAKQTGTLRGKLDGTRVRTRECNGSTRSYLEGWYVIAEANRIFGFDGWGRETVEARCIWQGRDGSNVGCSYLARVRITVYAGDRVLTREGSGAGHGRADSAGEAHANAVKEAETDATKRALATFGNRFGLALYDPKQNGVRQPSPARERTVRHEPRALRADERSGAQVERSLAEIAPMLVRPIRRRDKQHLQFVGSQPCLVCGRTPSHAHHVNFLQPRGMGQKASDEFTVPLCAIHHRALHDSGKEQDWWTATNIDPAPHALSLWQMSQRTLVDESHSTAPALPPLSQEPRT